MIEEGKRIKFNYCLSVEGKIIDSTKRQPFEYVHGRDKIIPGLKRELEGMTQGEEKTITLEPEDAYGEDNPLAYKEFPRSQLPEDMKPEIGMTLELRKAQGESDIAVISGIRDDSIILNFNHPLAGKTLTFEIKIIEVS